MDSLSPGKPLLFLWVSSLPSYFSLFKILPFSNVAKQNLKYLQARLKVKNQSHQLKSCWSLYEWRSASEMLMGSQKAALQVRWVKSQWRVPSTEPRIWIISQLEHGQCTGEMAAHTQANGRLSAALRFMKRVTLTRQHWKCLWVILSSPGYIEYKYCEWREVLKRNKRAIW